jgi:hypothetical protein
MKSEIQKYRKLDELFHNAWNEGARPGDDLSHLKFLEDADPEDIRKLYSSLRISQHFLESQVDTLAGYCEARYITVPSIEEILDNL